MTAAIALSGCAKLKDAQITSTVKDVAQITPVVCEAAKFFASQGRDIPGVNQCEKIVPVLTSDELKQALEIVGCAEQFDVKSVGFADCAVENGWPAIKAKLEQLEGK